MTLKELRKKRRLTLRTLSKLSGVGLSTIGNYETGKTTIAEESLKKIAGALGVSLDYLRDPVSVIQTGIDSQRQVGGFKMEAQVAEEVRARIEQFPLADERTRRVFIDQILHRLEEYAAWCEGHYSEMHEALIAYAKGGGHDSNKMPAKQKRSRLSDVHTISLAVFSEMGAGAPLVPTDRPIGTVRVRRGRFADDAFAARARGNSMIGIGVRDGDTVVLRWAEYQEARPEDIVCVHIYGDGSVLKQLKERDGHRWLVSRNPAHPDICLDCDGDPKGKIQAVMVGKI